MLQLEAVGLRHQKTTLGSSPVSQITEIGGYLGHKVTETGQFQSAIFPCVGECIFKIIEDFFVHTVFKPCEPFVLCLLLAT